MAVAIENAHDDDLDFHFAPDGRARTATRKVVIDEMPLDPFTQEPVGEFAINAGHFGLPWIESVDIEGEGAEWDDASASVVVKGPGEWTLKAYAPPEFTPKKD